MPEKVWNLSDSDDCDKDVRYDLDHTNEEEESWWNQKTLTNLDLSSNALTCISENLKNLADLTVLNVSKCHTFFGDGIIFHLFVIISFCSYKIML